MASDYEDYGDLTPAEQSRRVKVLSYKSDKEESGEYEELTYKGDYDSMVALAQREVEKGPLENHNVTATVTREEGDWAELRLRIAEFRTGEEPGNDDEDELENGEDEVMTKERPMWSFNCTITEEPLPTHPKYAKWVDGQSTEVKICINVLMQEGNLGQEIPMPDGTSKLMSKVLAPYKNNELIKKLVRHRTTYKDFLCEATKTYRTKRRPVVEMGGKIVDQLSGMGSPRTPKGRNWLHLGSSVSWDGERYCVTETYLMSGSEGWDPDLYASENTL